MKPGVDDNNRLIEKYLAISTSLSKGEALVFVELAGAYRMVLVEANTPNKAQAIGEALQNLQLGDVRYADEDGYSIAAAKWSTGELGLSRSSNEVDLPALANTLSNMGLKTRTVVRYPMYGKFTGESFPPSDSQRSHWIDATNAKQPIRLDVELPNSAPLLVFLFLAFPGVATAVGLLTGVLVGRSKSIDIKKRRKLYPKIVNGAAFGSMIVHTPIFLLLISTGAIRPIVDLWLGTSKITSLMPVLLISTLFVFLVLPINTVVEKKLFGPDESLPPQPILDPQEAASAKKVAWLTMAPTFLGLAIMFGPRMIGVSSNIQLICSGIGLVLVLGGSFLVRPFIKSAGLERPPTEEPAITELAQEVASNMQLSKYKVVVGHMPLDRTMINAAAVRDGTITLSERAVADLTEPELRALIAHEMAHLKLRHNEKRQRTIFMAMGLVLLPMALLFASRQFLTNPAIRIGLMAVPLACYPFVFILTRRSMRREEYEADELAVQVTGDPASLESALTKLVRASPMPHYHDVEDLSTHPAMGARIKAIRAMMVELRQ